MAYGVEYTEESLDHLRSLPARLRSTILDQLERRLRHDPTGLTRNRKPMDPDKRMYVAPWELRLGEVRVYYSVEEDPVPMVVIVAVGMKKGSRVFIGGKEVEP